MQTAEVRSFFQQQLSTEAAVAHYGVAPASAVTPYLVWNLEEVSYEDGFSLQELEVDVVDSGEDTAAVESVADDLQQRLDHLYAMTDTFHVSVYRERRQPIYENDKTVIRRRLTFQVRLHERS